MFDRISLLARTDRSFLITGLVLLLLLLADLMLVMTGAIQRSDNAARREQVRERSAALNALRVGTENAAMVLGKSREIKSLSERLERPVVQSDMVSAVFDLAGQTGVTVRDQNFLTPGEQGADSPALAQTLVLSGKYREVRAFVKKIEEHATGITVVEGAEIAADDGGKVLARLKLKTYRGTPGNE